MLPTILQPYEFTGVYFIVIVSAPLLIPEKTMTRPTQLLLGAVLLIAFTLAANAQSPSPAKNPQPPAKTAAVEKNGADKDRAALEEAKRIEEQRRATAITLLLSVAEEARSYRNQLLRARVQSRAADILWDTDVEKARTLFRRGWDAAEIADADSQRRFDEERRAAEKQGKGWSGSAPPSLRTEVLRMAAKRDRALGEEFLGKLDEARKQDADNVSAQPVDKSIADDPHELPSALRLRLRLARQLLDSDVPRAIEFADPALVRVSVDGLVFLCYLREKNAAAADQRYAAMLARAGADLLSDANTVSLLSAYAFTPFLFVRFSTDGGTNTNQYDQGRPAPDLSPELRTAFFRVAADIFLRPLPPPDQDRTTSGRVGKYMVMARLIPLFEQYAPEETTRLVKAQMTALAPEARGTSVNAPESPTMVGLSSEESETDSIESILKQAERAENQERRDDLYAQAALVAAGKGDPRATEFADKIDETEMRKSVRAYVDFNLVLDAIEKKKFEEAIPLTRKGALSNMQRIWALTQIAKAYVKTDKETANELLDEANAEARRISGSSAERPRAMVAVATVLYELDRQRAWDAMSEVARAANNVAEEFSGEDSRITATLHIRNQNSVQTHTADGFDLPGIFRLLAKENLDRSILLAKDFNGEAPRATASIAIARATLEKKPEKPGAKK